MFQDVICRLTTTTLAVFDDSGQLSLPRPLSQLKILYGRMWIVYNGNDFAAQHHAIIFSWKKLLI